MTETDEQQRLRDRLVALTRDLVLIPSIPSRPDDRRRCYEFVKNHLDSLAHIRVTEYDVEGFPSMVAKPEGCDEPDILVCAHLDVITHPDISFYRAIVEDGRIIGPGAGDMKGALAIMIELFRTLHQRHDNLSLGIVVTSDEETGGEHGIGHLFNEVGLRCGEAIIPDGGSIDEITVDEKGILHVHLTCRGHAAHAARPWLGNNPLDQLVQQLGALRARFADWQDDSPDHWYPTCALTVVETENTTTNRVPSDAHAVLDIRFPPPHTVDSMLTDLRETLSPNTELEVIIGAETTHLQPDPQFRDMMQDTIGRPASLVRESGGSDARFLCRQGIPVQMARPLVGNLHAADEWIDINSMLQFYSICEQYISAKLGTQLPSGP